MSSQYTGTGIAMVIFFSFPVIVLLSTITNRQPINKFTILTLFAMMLGLYLLQHSNTHAVNITGIFLGIIAASFYALYVIGSKHISSSTIDSNILAIIVCLGCTFIFLLSSIFLKNLAFPHSIHTWIYLLAIGILATALPIQLMLEGLKHISSVRASIISVLEPLVTVVVGTMLFNESISTMQMIGIAIILASTLLTQLQKQL